MLYAWLHQNRKSLYTDYIIIIKIQILDLTNCNNCDFYLLTLYYNIDEITNEEDLINNMNTDRLFCIIINEYDKKHLNPNQNIGSGPKQ